MKILHLGDLHIGRRFHDVSLIEDQALVLKKVIDAIQDEKIDVVMIAGDIYDKSNPSEAAFNLWDDFLTELSKLDIHVIVISGNHDSQERLAFGSRIFGNHNIHIVSRLRKSLEPIEIDNVRFYPVPFVRPSMVRNTFESFTQTSYEDAYQFLIDTIGPLDKDFFNILIGHQFFIYHDEVKRSDSETISMGGLDSIPVGMLNEFDYLAAGHIHRSQQIGNPHFRYSGSLLKYSFSESKYEKQFPILDIDSNARFELTSLHLEAKRDVRVLEGPFEMLMNEASSDDYIKVVLTDHTEIHDAISRLRVHYPNLLTVESVKEKEILASRPDFVDTQLHNPLEILKKFYEKQKLKALTEEQLHDIESTLADMEVEV